MTDGGATGPVLCFGEVLWDSLPQGMFPGGAPINVAYHLKRLGMRALPVTAVGRDALGDELLRRLQWWGLEEEFVSVLDHKATGLVRVQLNESGHPSYEIVQDVAWDWIEVTKELLALAPQSAALVFGSLAQRSGHNRGELERLRRQCTQALQVFDVNLRPPFAQPELVWRLAAGTDLIKLNDQEIQALLQWDPVEESSLVEQLEQAAREFAARTRCGRVCVTAGASGAGLLSDGRWFWAQSKPVIVKDTIGAGDSFLAALVNGLLDRGLQAVQQTLENACRVAEFVASREGATPAYSCSASGEIIAS